MGVFDDSPDTPTSGTSTIPYGPSPVAPDSSGGGQESGISLVGISGLFSAVGNAFASGYRAVNPVVNTPQGNLVYDPSTGRLISPTAIAAQQTTTSIMPILIVAAIALVAYMALKK